MTDEPRVLRHDEIAALSGIQQLQQMIAGKLPGPPMAKLLNFTLVEATEDQVVFKGTPTAAMLNPLGSVHGGWAATLLDSALGCAVHATLASGETYTTLEFKVNLLRAIMPDTGEVTGQGRIVHRGRRTAMSEATLTRVDGKLLAHGTETCLILSATL